MVDGPSCDEVKQSSKEHTLTFPESKNLGYELREPPLQGEKLEVREVSTTG